MYEGVTSLLFIRQNQVYLRFEVYCNLNDFLELHPNGYGNKFSVERLSCHLYLIQGICDKIF